MWAALVSASDVDDAPLTLNYFLSGFGASLFEILDECERRVIVDMLEKTNWSQTEAAERFQIPLSTLNQKIKRLNIEIKRKSRNSHAREREEVATPERAHPRS